MKPRYHIDKVNYDFDKWNPESLTTEKKLTTLKFDMSYITGNVYCDAGTIGYHENGKKHGVHKMWDESIIDDPIIYMGLWNMGNREGAHKWHHSIYTDIVRHEINYKNDILDGVEKKWERNGQLIKQIEWKDGIILTSKEWDQDGNMK